MGLCVTTQKSTQSAFSRRQLTLKVDSRHETLLRLLAVGKPIEEENLISSLKILAMFMYMNYSVYKTAKCLAFLVQSYYSCPHG